MRICIVGDQHFRYELPYASAFQDGRRGEWEAVKQKVIETAKDCEAVVLLGDNLNTKHNNSHVIREFVDFLKQFDGKEIHIISGNHERFGQHTAIDFLQALNLPNIRVYTRICNDVKIGSQRCSFVPYTTFNDLDVHTRAEADNKIWEKLTDGDILFAHHAVVGSKNYEYFDKELVLDSGVLEKRYKSSFFGHVHTAQNIGSQVYGVGSLFTAEVGEEGKTIAVYDTDTRVVSRIPMPVRGIYKIFISNEKEGMKQLMSIPSNSIVKAIITDRSVTPHIEDVKKMLSMFDASLLSEQYPSERERVHYDKDSALDLSMENLLKIFAESKKISYNDLISGLELIRQ